MPKIMLINVTHAEESRVGIVTDGVLSAFEIESFSREHLKGNIYRGIVRRIHPALEAAFVDIGAERDAFLPLDEICFRNLPRPPEGAGNGAAPRQRLRIQEILRPGDELLVQIVKEQFANKPPTLSTFYSLPGRYLVLLPGSDESGISRRIEGEERARIRELIDKLHPPEGFGIIVRTVAGFDQGARELQRDLKYLLRLWEKIQQTAASRRAPSLVYREHDLVLRNIRDYFTPDIDEIYIDNEEVYHRAREFLAEVMPGKENVLRLYEGEQPIFSHFDVEGQIESIYKRRVPLPSGGSIVIDGTEALTAIDVNSGRSIRGANQEQTAFRTNREAAVEIARQLRLRDVGGLIVIDFIDMKNPQHIAEIERTLRSAMHEDKARHEVGRISHFGLLEVSRQRLRPAASATSYVACPMCEGHGLVRTPESAALVALRKIHNRVAKGDVAFLRVSMPTEVGLYLLNQKREALAQLERRYGLRIQIALDDQLMPHQSELEIRPRGEGEPAEQPFLRLGGVTAAEPQPAALASDNGGASDESAAPPPPAPQRSRRARRRRGRRRRGRLSEAGAVAEASQNPTPESPATGTEVSAPPGAQAAGEPDAPEEYRLSQPDTLEEVGWHTQPFVVEETPASSQTAASPAAEPGDAETASSPDTAPIMTATGNKADPALAAEPEGAVDSPPRRRGRRSQAPRGRRRQRAGQGDDAPDATDSGVAKPPARRRGTTSTKRKSPRRAPREVPDTTSEPPG